MTGPRTSTRAKLFDAAVSLISQQELHATTVEQIVELAGVAKGTVYYHFKSKNELFQALLIEGLTRLADACRKESQGASSPTEALAGVVRAELENIVKYEAFARLMMSQLWRADSLWSEDAIRVLHEEIFGVIREALEKGQAAGEFRTGFDARMAAPVIFGMVATAALGRARSGEGLTADESFQYLFDMTLGTVRI
jgi:AcrR family transcriptional regulator